MSCKSCFLLRSIRLMVMFTLLGKHEKNLTCTGIGHSILCLFAFYFCLPRTPHYLVVAVRVVGEVSRAPVRAQFMICNENMNKFFKCQNEWFYYVRENKVPLDVINYSILCLGMRGNNVNRVRYTVQPETLQSHNHILLFCCFVWMFWRVLFSVSPSSRLSQSHAAARKVVHIAHGTSNANMSTEKNTISAGLRKCQPNANVIYIYFYVCSNFSPFSSPHSSSFWLQQWHLAQPHISFHSFATFQCISSRRSSLFSFRIELCRCQSHCNSACISTGNQLFAIAVSTPYAKMGEYRNARNWHRSHAEQWFAQATAMCLSFVFVSFGSRRWAQAGICLVSIFVVYWLTILPSSTSVFHSDTSRSRRMHAKFVKNCIYTCRQRHVLPFSQTVDTWCLDVGWLIALAEGHEWVTHLIYLQRKAMGMCNVQCHRSYFRKSKMEIAGAVNLSEF